MSAPIRVLIADDALFMRNMLRGIFEDADDRYQVVGEASHGIEVVDKYRQLKPDVVTMDLVMPHQDGVVATRAIIAEDPEAIVLICSSLGEESKVIEAIDAGAVDFVVKPFEGEDVRRLIEKALAALQKSG